MSELTRCNYCSLLEYRRRARQNKQRLTLLLEDGGIVVYIHPRNLNIRKATKEEKKLYWVSWMMELSDHCVC